METDSTDKSSTRSGRRVRSGDAQDVRCALLSAAAECFSQRGYRATPLREIAAAAGANAAMIHYYFGGKRGLYEAMLEEQVAPALAQLQRWHELTASEEVTAAEILRIYVSVLMHNSWLPQLMMREVLSGEDGPGVRMIRTVAIRSKNLLSRLIAQQQSRGVIRGDIEPGLGALAIISLVMFPFIARPVVEPVLGVRMDEPFIEHLIQHHARFFDPERTGVVT